MGPENRTTVKDVSLHWVAAQQNLKVYRVQNTSRAPLARLVKIFDSHKVPCPSTLLGVVGKLSTRWLLLSRCRTLLSAPLPLLPAAGRKSVLFFLVGLRWKEDWLWYASYSKYILYPSYFFRAQIRSSLRTFELFEHDVRVFYLRIGGAMTRFSMF